METTAHVAPRRAGALHQSEVVSHDAPSVTAHTLDSVDGDIAKGTKGFNEACTIYNSRAGEIIVVDHSTSIRTGRSCTIAPPEHSGSVPDQGFGFLPGKVEKTLTDGCASVARSVLNQLSDSM